MTAQDLYNLIASYVPRCAQEEADKVLMLQLIREHPETCLTRENLTCHFTASPWIVNPDRTKTLMVYHKLYDSWSWTGGHADGEADLCAVALRELREETGVQHPRLVSPLPCSLELLTVDGHVKKGKYVSSHLHANVTFLVEADEAETLTVCEAENSGVRWLTSEEALTLPTEPWMVERVYRKLAKRCMRSGSELGVRS